MFLTDNPYHAEPVSTNIGTFDRSLNLQNVIQLAGSRGLLIKVCLSTSSGYLVEFFRLIHPLALFGVLNIF